MNIITKPLIWYFSESNKKTTNVFVTKGCVTTMPKPLIHSSCYTDQRSPSHRHRGIGCRSRWNIKHPLHYISTHNHYVINVHWSPDGESLRQQQPTNNHDVHVAAERNVQPSTIQLDGSSQCIPPHARGSALFAAILNDTSESDYYPRRIQMHALCCYVICDIGKTVEIGFDPPIANPNRLLIRIRAGHYWRNGGLIVSLLDSSRNIYKQIITKHDQNGENNQGYTWTDWNITGNTFTSTGKV